MPHHLSRKLRWFGSIGLLAMVLLWTVAASGAAHATNPSTPTTPNTSPPTTTPATPTTPSTPDGRAALYVRPAIVFIETAWTFRVLGPVTTTSMGQLRTLRSRCTGFIVSSDGYIGTAGHCVDPEQVRDSVLISFASTVAADQVLLQAVVRAAQARGIRIATANDLLAFILANWKLEGAAAGSGPDRRVFVQHGAAVANLTTEQAWPARVIDYRPLREGDAALIKVERDKLPVAEVSDARHVTIGTPVLAIGFPATNDDVTDVTWEPTFKDGSVSSKRTNGSFPVFEISAALSGGMSGGPTVDRDGRVVGINSYGHARESGAFKFVSSSSLLMELLRTHGVVNQLSDIDETYRSAADAFLSGDLRTAARRLDDVLSRSPAHRQAQDLRVQVADQLAARGESISEPVAEQTAADVSPTSGQDGTDATMIVLIAAAVAASCIGIVVLRARFGVKSARHAAGATPSAASGAASNDAAVAPVAVPVTTADGPSRPWWLDLPVATPQPAQPAPQPPVTAVSAANGHRA
jgi:S1-C subfamily serine protease